MMTSSTLRVVRRGLALIWITLVVAVAALIAIPHVAPHFGYQTLAVRGDVMAQALPTGSLVVVRHAPAAEIRVGDIVTFRSDDNILTRRVTAVAATSAGEPRFVANGDGGAPSQALDFAAAALIGRADAYVPLAGDALGFLASMAGAVLTLSVLGGLMLVRWTLDDLLIAHVRRRGEAFAGAAG